ncbi:MAG: N-acetylmuramoyl-L-alanine amidase [Clostridia bacterium]|jgi:N-acetylmuramoyl-L-alanine amidase CwlA|nr:N-acetylmuramoyl-L-alanine amidase [Clostridia bacterium]
MNIKQELLTPNQYTRPQIRLQHIKAIAIHYTGDPDASAQNEHDYFNSTCIAQKRFASCHYAVGLQGEIVQLIPETEWSYCTNQANGYTISIETCHPDSTGKFNAASEKSLIELTASLCKKYGLNPLSGGVIRHYDVTKKVCPKYYVDHPAAWAAFKTAVHNCMINVAYTLPSYNTVVSAAAAVSPAYCDTTIDMKIKRGQTYTIATGSKAVTTGNSAIIQTAGQTYSGGKYLTKLKAAGGIGQCAGVFVNGMKKFTATVS